jgi:glycosyltransferase involved in cell wall biosynthesis
MEPCGTVVMEANAVGKAMIATNHGGFTELIERDQTGLLVPPNDAQALADVMQALISNEALRISLARNALAKAESFKAKSIVPKIEAIYQRVCSARSPQTGSASAARILQEH